MTTRTINIDKLIEIAQSRAKLDGRRKNRGRPKIPFPKDETIIVSTMRKRGIALRNIHQVMKEEKLTRYENYGSFNSAWKSHLAE
jgi:hypothetical protein